uniref:hornerin-like n=1 Tax=Styela clava TaxID=7725 RepID=UPI001939D3A8|nr:hornerin-like [Styela clava]
MILKPSGKVEGPKAKGGPSPAQDKNIGILLFVLDGIIIVAAIFLLMGKPTCPDQMEGSRDQLAADYNFAGVGNVDLQRYGHESPTYNQFKPSSYGSSSYGSSGSSYSSGWGFISSLIGGSPVSEIHGPSSGSSYQTPTTSYGSTYSSVYNPGSSTSGSGSTYASSYSSGSSYYSSGSPYGSSSGYGSSGSTSTYGSNYASGSSSSGSGSSSGYSSSSSYGSTYGSNYGSGSSSSSSGSSSPSSGSTYGSNYGSGSSSSSSGSSFPSSGSTYGSNYGSGSSSSSSGSASPSSGSTYGSNYGSGSSSSGSGSYYGSSSGYGSTTSYGSNYGSGSSSSGSGSYSGSNYASGSSPSGSGSYYGSSSGSSSPTTYGSTYGSNYGSGSSTSGSGSPYGSNYGSGPSTYGSGSPYGSSYGSGSSTSGSGSSYGSSYSSGSLYGSGSGYKPSGPGSGSTFGSTTSTPPSGFGSSSGSSSDSKPSGSASGSSSFLSVSSLWDSVPIEEEEEAPNPITALNTAAAITPENKGTTISDASYPYSDLVDIYKEDIITNTNFKCGSTEAKPNLQTGRIVGGGEAVKHSWPWTVALMMRTGMWNGHISFMASCGGTIVSPRHVITAFHCFKNKAKSDDVSLSILDGDPNYNRRVFIGKHDVTKIIGEEYELAVVRPHPRGNMNLIVNDIALITTKKEIKFTDRVQPACLPKFKVIKPAGTQCWAVGWGNTKGTGDEGVLKQIRLPIVSLKECAKELGLEEHNNHDSISLCAGGDMGRDTCQGDSGGPLYCFDDGKATVYGATSWGYGCGKGTAGVYAPTSFNLRWLCCFMANIPSCRGVSCDPDPQFT